MDLSNIEEHLCASCNKSSESKSNLASTAYWVNIDERCRHRFCDKCYQKEFSIKRQFACPRCKHIVNKQNLSQKDPDEIEVERDFTIRKKIKGIYNKTIESFPSDLDYRNYEETVEDVIFNLVNNIDVEQTNKQVELYQKDHLQQIAEDQSRRQSEQDRVREEIRLSEESRALKDQDEKIAIIKDRMLNEERARQMNEIQLGEREEMTVPASSRGAPGASLTAPAAVLPAQLSYAPSHVLSVLSSRPEPKIIRIAAPEKHTGTAMHNMHAAGGYEFINYTKRNWVDIVEDITAHAQALSVGAAAGDNSNTNSTSDGTGAKGISSSKPYPWPLLWE